MAAKPDEIKTEIALELDSSIIGPTDFVRGVRAFFGLLNIITREVAGPGISAVRWNVQVSPGSAVVGVVPEGIDVDFGLVEVIKKTLKHGLSVLENQATRPPHFQDAAVRHVQELASLSLLSLRRDAPEVTVRVWVKRDPTTLTPRAVANTNELLGFATEDEGSIEGRLRVVAERGALHFVVYEPVWNREIRCFISEEVLPKALNAFRKRVEVFGTIRYRKDGTPISIQATDLVEFPPEDQLPDYRSVRGILREST